MIELDSSKKSKLENPHLKQQLVLFAGFIKIEKQCYLSLKKSEETTFEML